MSPGTQHHRRGLIVVFGLFLASRVTVGTYCLWAVADWIPPQGEKGLGLYLIGAFPSYLPFWRGWPAVFTCSWRPGTGTYASEWR
jgi:hypothetical protein